ncbi:hypothetical protein NLJ89_g8802 [Agrocybe chaxingu]|uniref:NmrA-like domain-containing protein n=1 Tax=Agrocybe chaxingu TaxID=84603 RepID=A0A9W8K161_9AGAR|nr:hypothetical protein NLJ89_g8802 [Agrocybe chaxingu]
MTTLITGGCGNTGSKLARLIQTASRPLLIASRSGTAPEPYKAVKFDWSDASTFENPFKADSNIDKVYIVISNIFDVLPIVQPFVDLSIAKGVKRFVLLSGSHTHKAGPYIGKLHEYIENTGVDFTVLRPTSFIENFAGVFAHSIRERNEIVSTAGNGRTPFVSGEDIAKAAFDALFADKSPNKEYYVVGPGLYSHDEVASLFSEILGRKVTHRRITGEEERAMLESVGMPPDQADFVSSAGQETAEGTEEALVGRNNTIQGTHTLREFIETNKHVWMKE